MMRDISRKLSLLLALLCLLLLFVGGPGPDAPRSYKDFWDLGHLFCFALWTWLYLEWRPRQGVWKQLGLVLALAFIVGGATELLQAKVGRDASWADLQKDLLGSQLTFLFLNPARQQLRNWLLRGMQVFVVLAVLWTALPLVRVVTDEVIAWQLFPLLSGFETPLERERWGGDSQRRVVIDIVHSGQASLRVELNTDRYSGVFLRYFPADWSGYRLLRLQVFNPEATPFTIYFRIHDQLHRQHENAYRDRFNTSFVLKPGWTLLTIPLEKVAAAPKGRRMNMQRIAGVGLFVAKLTRRRTIYIDDVELVR